MIFHAGSLAAFNQPLNDPENQASSSLTSFGFHYLVDPNTRFPGQPGIEPDSQRITDTKKYFFVLQENFNRNSTLILGQRL